jgi:hypothetical protein
MMKIDSTTVWSNSSAHAVLATALTEAMQALYQLGEQQADQAASISGLARQNLTFELESVSHNVTHFPGGIFSTPRYVASAVAVVAIYDLNQ